MRSEGAAVLAPRGLRLSEAKTRVAHIDEGFDFLGWRIQRHQRRGGTKRYVYTYPSKKALASIVAKVRTITRQGTNLPLSAPLYRLNPLLRGWTNYFRPGVSSKAFSYLSHFTWHRVIRWLRRKHPGLNWKQFRRRCLPLGVVAGGGAGDAVQPGSGVDHSIPLSGGSHTDALVECGMKVNVVCRLGSWRAGCGGSRTSGSEGGPEKPTGRKAGRALRPDPYWRAS